MKPRIYTDLHRLTLKILCVCVSSLWLIFLSACSELEKPKTEPFYAQTAPPQKKEFRWSNGKMPKSFDPALASAPPETDIVRAVFEGLTDTNPKTLEATASVAEKWTASEDFKTWTFYLRKDAKWSNGENVKAQDFVRSWKRLAEMGDKVSHAQLLENIAGTRVLKPVVPTTIIQGTEVDLSKPSVVPNLPVLKNPSNTNTAAQKSEVKPPATSEKPLMKPEFSKSEKSAKEKTKTPPEVKFGAEAVNDLTLKVTLNEPDKDFPALVAHPMFRPIYGDGKDFEDGKLNAGIITNGAFRISSIGQEGITLDRAEHFWGKDSVELERVRFVPKENAEKALEAYRMGEVDAVTNASFEPLALKLLAPYNDFKRKTHSALNFYEFNRSKKPFDDRRVREALAISIERERLTEIEMDGSTRPALNFLPFDEETTKKLVQDKDRARELLAEAGFENGEDFPVIRLVVNRNDVQQRIARAVVKMWKQTLNIDTVIIVKEASEIETTRAGGEFDILRRGVVLPTADETAGLTAIFAPEKPPESEAPADNQTTDKTSEIPPKSLNSESKNTDETPSDQQPEPNTPAEVVENAPVLTEAEAISEISAIPLYFPTSYSLVKPYIQGFEINTLDAPSLKDVKIDNNWQPKKPNGES
ncbi:MAG TPA: peptide ABC transporter substrate-binding protein [Pyrinomonadaceae bacterium]|nr:peptide ABC transporter substrate-binding protein [Pyrinomonadaceae bacterium]